MASKQKHWKYILVFYLYTIFERISFLANVFKGRVMCNSPIVNISKFANVSQNIAIRGRVLQGQMNSIKFPEKTRDRKHYLYWIELWYYLYFKKTHLVKKAKPNY